MFVHLPSSVNSYSSRHTLKAELGSGTERNLLQEKSIIDRRNGIQKKLKRYLQLLPLYIPEYVKKFLAVIELGAQLAEDVLVPLPSSFTTQIRMATCPPSVTSIEERLREAQAFEALNDVRRYLRQRSFASGFKIKNITGQRANTRARQWINTINSKVINAKLLYRCARSCLLSIRGPGDWEKTLRVLADADVRAVNERALTAEEKADRLAVQEAGGVVDPVDGVAVQQTVSLGDGRRTLSWIWYASGGLDANDSETVNGKSSNVLHISWCSILTIPLQRYISNG